jgi:WbqC-like protein family
MAPRYISEEEVAMKLGIMQPYFFPYLGYFALIAKTDAWVVFDVSQYTPKSWMNRNRVLHPAAGWMYVTVPLKGSSRNMAIHEARVADRDRTHRSVLGKLSHYRKQAPNYLNVCSLVDQTFEGLIDDSLVQLNINGLRTVCTYMGIPFSYQIASEMDISISPVTHPGGWAPAISGSLEADEYINPIGGRALFDSAEFAANGVALSFLDMPTLVYPTGNFAFVPDLSILDVLMWNEPESVVNAIKTARVVKEA